MMMMMARRRMVTMVTMMMALVGAWAVLLTLGTLMAMARALTVMVMQSLAMQFLPPAGALRRTARPRPQPPHAAAAAAAPLAAAAGAAAVAATVRVSPPFVLPRAPQLLR